MLEEKGVPYKAVEEFTEIEEYLINKGLISR